MDTQGTANGMLCVNSLATQGTANGMLGIDYILLNPCNYDDDDDDDYDDDDDDYDEECMLMISTRVFSI